MDRSQVRRLLEKVSRGDASVADALEQLARLSTGDLGFARLDHHRALRRGFPEVVFGQGKTAEQTVAIVEHLAEREPPVLVTRLSDKVGRELAERFPSGTHNPVARTFVLRSRKSSRKARKKGLLIVSAGTSDLPVAEEAAVSAEALGLAPEQLHDVGVAGLGRLLEQQDTLRAAKVVVVVAGMEGALPGVIAGLVDVPVIGVPTSVGYGTALRGMTALMGMLTSCSSGLTVVNIDNGFGAACAAWTILAPRAKG